MTGERPTHCDGPQCHATKGAANKWLIAGIVPGGGALAIGTRWLDGQSLDFCSEACLHSYVSRFVAQLREREATNA